MRREARSDAVIEIVPEVARALKGREPVVALETTLAAHGFPAGEGIEVALDCRTASPGCWSRSGDSRGARRRGPRRAVAGSARAVHGRGAQGRPARPGRLRRARRRRRDDGWGHACSLPRRRHRLHGHGWHRRRTSGRTARRFRRSCRASPRGGARRLLRCEVVPRRPGDDGAARDAGRSRARLPHGRAAALLRRATEVRPSRRGSRAPTRRPVSRARTGGSVATPRSSSPSPRRRASTSSPSSSRHLRRPRRKGSPARP